MPKSAPQIGLLDDILEDDALEAKLNEWEQAKTALAPHLQRYRALDELVKGEIKSRGLEPGEHRCGKFVVTIGDRAERDVSFQIQARTSIRIKASPSAEGDE